jgi:hypothetical protein
MRWASTLIVLVVVAAGIGAGVLTTYEPRVESPLAPAPEPVRPPGPPAAASADAAEGILVPIHVVSAASGEPCTGVDVVAYAFDRSSRPSMGVTDASGEAAARVPPRTLCTARLVMRCGASATTYFISAADSTTQAPVRLVLPDAPAQPAARATPTIDVDTRTREVQELVVPRSGLLDVFAEDASGRALARRRVELRDAAGRLIVSGETGLEGRWSCVLVPGRWSVAIEDGPRSEIDVRADDVTVLRLR